MFDRKEDNLDAPKSKATPLPQGVVIRVMPRVEKDDAPAPAVPPKPAPAVLPPTPKPPVLPPVAKPAIAKSKRRPWWATLLWLLLIVGLFFGVVLVYQEFIIPRIGVEENPPEQQTNQAPTPAPEAPNPTPQEQPTVTPTLQPGLDTDSDGLTDREESLYGTDLRNPDTDADSFLDGNEVFHRFDPLGLAPSTLLINGSVKEIAPNGAASLTYPSSWNAIETAPESGWLVTLQPLTSSRITVQEFTLESENAFESFILSRLAEITPDTLAQTPTIAGFTTSASKNGYVSYTHPSGRIIYLLNDNQIFEFYYDTKTERTVEYLQTFQMIVNSFSVL